MNAPVGQSRSSDCTYAAAAPSPDASAESSKARTQPSSTEPKFCKDCKHYLLSARFITSAALSLLEEPTWMQPFRDETNWQALRRRWDPAWEVRMPIGWGFMAGAVINIRKPARYVTEQLLEKQ